MNVERENTGHSDKFDPHLMIDYFSMSLVKTRPDLNDQDDVAMKEYIQAYEEINKFLASLGKIFYFVISDVKEKIKLLEDYLHKDNNNYKTILTMVEFEKGQKMLSAPENATRNNATRNLLRLHRALLFIYKFLDGLVTSDPKTVKLPQLCSDIYLNTLGKYHPWIIRKAATFGMMGLPKPEVLQGLMGIKNEEEARSMAKHIRTLEKVYNITEKIYENHKILDLP